MGTNAHSLSTQAGYPDLSRLANARVRVFAGSGQKLEFGGSPQQMVAPGRGKCAIITRVVGQGVAALAGSTAYVQVAGSPATMETTSSRLLFRHNDDLSKSPDSMHFQNWERNELVFGTPELSCPPDRQIDWEPRMPICIPSEWECASWQLSRMGNGLTGYGYIVDEQDARAMGFDIDNVASPAQGIFRQILTGKTATSSAFDLIPAVTGCSIQILDIYVRLQHTAVGSATMTLSNTTGDTIMVFRNASRANYTEWKLSPGIYVKKDEALQLTGDAEANGNGSVCIIGRYVDNDDVPSNQFWGYLSPASASPTSSTTQANVKNESSVMTLNYVGPVTTATTPGQGRQHIVEGYHISLTKDATATSDHVWFALTSGTGDGDVGNELATITQGNSLISPIMSASLAYQTVNLSVDRISVPTVPNTGRIQVDVNAIGGNLAQSPQSDDTDIEGFDVTVWGRTVDTERATTDNPQFTGGTG